MTEREYHVISVYADAQALEDGVLVDVREAPPTRSTASHGRSLTPSPVRWGACPQCLAAAR